MLRILIISLFVFIFSDTKAEENYFLSLKYNKVNVRYGPGLDYPIKFIYLKKNFPVEIYNELLKSAHCLIGNSSSFIREASYLGSPSIIVGDRQFKREKSKNVGLVNFQENEIYKIVKKYEGKKFKKSTIYGDGKASARIVKILEQLKEINIQKLDSVQFKTFSTSQTSGSDTGNAGKMSFHIDESEILSIQDGGILGYWTKDGNNAFTTSYSNPDASGRTSGMPYLDGVTVDGGVWT